MPELKNNNPPSRRLAITPASYVILRRGNEVLMTRRFQTGYMDGKWSLPAGHFDGGETAADVALREANEEVGVHIKLEDLKFVHIIHRVAQEGNYERVDFFFETTKWNNSVTNKEPHKCDAVGWFSLDALPAAMTPEVELALSSMRRGLSYSSLNF